MIALIGKSGSGKTTIEKLLVEKGYKKAVSLTSRDMRVGEVEGLDYYYKSKEEMERIRSKGEIAEWIEFLGNVYALTKEECIGSDVVVVEPKGLVQLKAIEELDITAVYLNCTEEERIVRMRGRGDKEEKVQERVINDRVHFVGLEEMAEYTINNTEQSVEETLKEVERIIVEIEG